jgi:hypothetical protein
MHAAQAAQSAAVDARDQLREIRDLFDRRDQPADFRRFMFTAANPVRTWHNHVEAPTQSFGVYNPTLLTVMVGIGGGSAVSTNEPLTVPPTSLVVMPIALAAVEIGVDPLDPNLGANTAVVFGFRWTTVRDAFLGKGA